MPLRFAFDNSYARLPPRFYARVEPEPVAAPALVRVNHALAASFGLDALALQGAEAAAIFAGNRIPEGAEPIALAYAGHQFGGFSPQLGDGRAVLLGEVAGRDIQLKGSGPTPFSRRGDGRAALGPVLREFIVSEAMAALGVPTTRALAAALTGETVMRETALPGAVLTRVAASHLRVGTFQYFAVRRDTEGLRILADYAIARHDPGASPRDFFVGVVRRQASLVAQWLALGFVHGVMNTDNCTISGETIDYGPCAFIDAYDPNAVFSAIDYESRYAFSRQPRIVQWNLARLAEAMLPLFDADDAKAVTIAEAALAEFALSFQSTYLATMRRKLALEGEAEGDGALIQALLAAMEAAAADYTLTFHALATAAEGDPAGLPPGLDAWLPSWRARIGPDAAKCLRAANPAVIPRTHLIEAAIVAAVERQDFSVFHALAEATARPFEANPAFMAPPREEERVLQTFCGT